MDRSEKDLQGKTFKEQDLSGADFSEADLRGADFSRAILKNADFSECKTGLKTFPAVLVFLFALVISLLSGYIAMLTGSTVQMMLKSADPNVVMGGYVTIGLMLIFIVLIILKGGGSALKLISISIILALLVGLISWLFNAGSGLGAIYSSFSIILFVIMIGVGTTARATAGTLSSNILFIIVALSGGLLSKSIGGGIGTAVLAISCAIISKRALKGTKGFENLRKAAYSIGSRLGTSFKGADLTGANFSGAVVKNTNFRGAVLLGVNWEKAVRKFSIEA